MSICSSSMNRATRKHTITPYTLAQPEEVSTRGTGASSSSSGPRSATQQQTQTAGEGSRTGRRDSRPRSDPSPDLSRSPSGSARSARLSSSLLPALRLAGLAYDRDPRRDMRSSRSSRESAPRPKPLLTLKLSSSSFLDAVIRDEKTRDPLYILETTTELTAIYRLDHLKDEPVKAATVQWPLHPVRIKGKSGRSIQFGNGSWREAEDLLKSGPLGNTAIRKFNIPHYPNSIKWKLIPGNCFCCVTNAIKGPIAVLDAATLNAPPRLKIFETLTDKEAARSQDNYKGVPTILLDYIIVTAMLLVTDVQEWLDRPREARIPGSNAYVIQRWLALIHNRPAPPEPDHPTVDLSLTVPSTPPHSATYPSPGGLWDTQSGVTSLSGSNGSGSGASYLGGEPFTPTTPGTPSTSMTSAHSSAFLPRCAEDAPPVPPVPSTSSGSSPFAFNVESGIARERPKSNPPASSHSPSSSTSTAQAPSGDTHPFASQPEDEISRSLPRARPPQTLSLHSGVQIGSSVPPSIAASPTSTVPTTPFPGTSTPSTASSSSRPMRRQLPTPPGPAPPHSFNQPWLYSSGSAASTPPATSSTASSSSTPSSATLTPITPPSPSSSMNARALRASIQRPLRSANIPPPPPPPQHQIPLPPKLAQDAQGYGGRMVSRPHTAPEIETGNRRRHSAGEFGDYPGHESSSSVHPYAAAVAPMSLRGPGDRDDLTGRMQGLRMSGVPGPSHVGGHIRAPSQPAPEYDAHSFVDMPPPLPPIPPLPIPPSSSPSSGLRSPPGQGPGQGRRVLTVVNADALTMPLEDPGRCLPSDRERDARLRTRVSYVESVYEAPPPAYDAIDFSVPPVPSLSTRTRAVPPPLPPLPQVAPLRPTPLPMPPLEAGGEGRRTS